MLRSAFSFGLTAALLAPHVTRDLTSRIDALRATRAVDIRHEQESPDIEHFAGYSVRQVMAIANRRRLIADGPTIERILASIRSSRPTPSVHEYDCHWAIRFLNAHGQAVATIGLNGFGLSGSLDDTLIAFASSEFVHELERLVPDRPLTKEDRYLRVLLPCGRPSERS